MPDDHFRREAQAGSACLCRPLARRLPRQTGGRTLRAQRCACGDEQGRFRSGGSAPPVADCRAPRTRAERARYLCSCCRRLPADTAPVPALGSGEGDRAAGLGLTIQIVALRQRGSSGPVNESIRAGLSRPLLDPDGSSHATSRRLYCCSDEPARGPSACSRPGGGRLSKRITLVWAQSLRLAKH